MNVRLSELDREIQQLEQRIADDRVQLMSALGDCRHSVRETVSSPKSLLTVAAVGFIAGRLLLPGKAKAETKQTQRQSRAGSVLGLLTAGLSLVQPGYGASMTRLLGDENAIRTAGEGTEALTLSFDSEDRDRYVRAATTVRVTLDAVRGTYRHEVDTEATFLKDRSIGTFEFVDPLTYNNKEPGRGVRNRWLPAGHRWGVLRGADGQLHIAPGLCSPVVDAENLVPDQEAGLVRRRILLDPADHGFLLMDIGHLYAGHVDD